MRDLLLHIAVYVTASCGVVDGVVTAEANAYRPTYFRMVALEQDTNAVMVLGEDTDQSPVVMSVPFTIRGKDTTQGWVAVLRVEDINGNTRRWRYRMVKHTTTTH